MSALAHLVAATAPARYAALGPGAHPPHRAPPPVLGANLVSDLHELFTYHFMVTALAAGTVVAVLAAAVGWVMVLRRQSFAGHTLAVVGFPGAAGATLVGLPIAVGYFGACVAAALVIAAIPRGRAGSSRGAESAVTGAVQAFALAAGVLFVNLYQGFLNGVDALLFGSFLGITDSQVWSLTAVAVGALALLVLLGRPLLFASVDPDVARARGVPVRALSLAFVVLLGVAVAAASEITGSLLVFALLVMPAAAAQQVTARPGLGLVLSVALGLLVTWSGLAVAYFSIYPSGFYLTSFGFAVYLVAAGVRGVSEARSRRVAALGRGA
ncbi:MAG TPA: metal ABC transporter permease [Acidimicrobiales bacterium]|nr:metal ABC transporter permease [Acidimicrobiales bacterium]